MSGPPDHLVLLSPGAKAGLTRAFVEAATATDIRVLAWESDPCSPAARFCDDSAPGGPVEDAAAAAALLDWCLRERVKLVVPTRHDDLPTLARHRARFEEAGVSIVVSSLDTVALALDKRDLSSWLRAHDFPTPPHTTPAEWERSSLAGNFPLIAKHPKSSGSRRVAKLARADDLASVPTDWILQAFAPGIEVTVNTYVDRAGRCACEIPHERLLVSDGEVLRARTWRHPAIMALARRISETLPGARGPLNIQLFWDDESRSALVTDINPRFGGGYPLAHRAGGCFTAWLIDEYIRGVSPGRCEDWEDRLLMARYREASFFPDTKS